MCVVVTYMGYDLETDGHSYQSKINGRVLKFDTAGMWVDYINKIVKK